MAYAVGDRGEVICRRLWDRIPPGWRRGLCFTDFWKAYALVVPEAQHCPGGKETGPPNHVGGFYDTHRQRPVRFVRDTVSFRKRRLMHKIALCSFLHDSNRQQALRSKNRN